MDATTVGLQIERIIKIAVLKKKATHEIFSEGSEDGKAVFRVGNTTYRYSVARVRGWNKFKVTLSISNSRYASPIRKEVTFRTYFEGISRWGKAGIVEILDTFSLR